MLRQLVIFCFYTGLLIFLVPYNLSAQTDSLQKKNNELFRKALQLREDKKTDESGKILTQLVLQQPSGMNYLYELAFHHCIKKEFDIAISKLTPVLDNKNVNDQIYQLLGHIYDVKGQKELAKQTFQKGLKKFPDSGPLYLESAMLPLAAGKYDEALAFIEKGIELDPAFPSNYYYAARIYCNSDDKVWGLIYGEIFMNLERNTYRTLEISKLLYDTYQKSIRFTSDSTCLVNFSDVGSYKITGSGDATKLSMSYGLNVYQPVISMSVFGIQKFDLASVCRIRSRFIQYYFSSGANKKYPVILFDYELSMWNNNLLDAYSYWLLQKGNEKEYLQWKEKNKDAFNAFMLWFTQNPMQLSKGHGFYRGQID
jgi:tetratricopeptide (TPR) repeat protein